MNMHPLSIPFPLPVADIALLNSEADITPLNSEVYMQMRGVQTVCAIFYLILTVTFKR